MAIEVFGLPTLETNYSWIVRDLNTKQTLVIDPAEALPIKKFLSAKNWKTDVILNTHHHHDHIGGNLELQAEFKCPIYAFEKDAYRIPGITHELAEGDIFDWQGLKAEVIFLPGHTLGQIAYYFKTDEKIFLGDCLFALGCGRLFEGTASQMFSSLKKLQTLPPQTMIYCGHEYALTNAPFAEVYMGHRPEFQNRLKAIKQLRQKDLPTVPFTLKQELLTNPFFNASDLTVKEKLKMQGATELEVFTELRLQKDRF